MSEKIINQLNQIIDIKKDIKEAIKLKGVNITDDTPFNEYANLISLISNNSGEGI